jgi:hypothetical protein
MRGSHILLTSLALTAACMPAAAQDNSPAPPDAPPPRQGPPDGDRGGPRRGPGMGMREPLSPEKAKAAWTLEAKTAAARLKLNDEQTGKTVEAYTAAREQHHAAMEELREQLREDMEANDDADGDPREGWRDMRTSFEALHKTQRDSLVTNLTAIIGAESAGKATASLGTFNPAWDVMVDALSGFNMKQENLDKALASTEAYVMAVNQARASAEDNPETARTAMQEARDSFIDAIKPMLTDEQVDQVRRSARMAGPGGFFGGPGGPGASGRQGGRRNNDPDAPPPPPPSADDSTNE